LAFPYGYVTSRWKTKVYLACIQIKGAAAMPRYFFNVRDGEQVNEDVEGIELDGLPAVENKAMTSAKEDHRRGAAQRPSSPSWPQLRGS
jgi:hypothetical protein